MTMCCCLDLVMMTMCCCDDNVLFFLLTHDDSVLFFRFIRDDNMLFFTLSRDDNVFFFSLSRDDMTVRALMLSFLSQLLPSSAEHRIFAAEILSVLFTKHRQLQKLLSYRNFPNSLPHRQKHRIVCAVLVLEPFAHLVCMHYMCEM